MNIREVETKVRQMKQMRLTREDAQYWASAHPLKGFDPSEAAELIDKMIVAE
jgi:hypothetical protein